MSRPVQEKIKCPGCGQQIRICDRLICCIVYWCPDCKKKYDKKR